MKILLIEDANDKALVVTSVLSKANPNCIIQRASNIAEAVRLLETHIFELIVLDLYLPLVENSATNDVSKEVLNIVQKSNLNKTSDIVALSAYEELVKEHSDNFARHGVIVCLYSETEQSWQTTIDSIVKRSAEKLTKSFLIICALEIERDGFYKSDADVSPAEIVHGLSANEIDIGEHSGLILTCPRMGLVNAGIIAALGIDRFSPKVVCMPGICAGMSNETKIGQVLIGNPCFEYQVGKHSSVGFEIEPYQIQLKESVRQQLELLSNDSDLTKSLYTSVTNIEENKPKLCPFSSGSAVVADDTEMKRIAQQHRKLGGIDMEASAVMHAASLTDEGVDVFIAKAVVDFADKKKSDDFQDDCCTISAKFCTNAIAKILEME